MTHLGKMVASVEISILSGLLWTRDFASYGLLISLDQFIHERTMHIVFLKGLII